ncbi:MAG TPA: hypothetical protein VG758_23815, partial [Hyphomicrobiaceae bacterium]|nr:hypothetical protein [Hyphomicrobiaceae bacterium]
QRLKSELANRTLVLELQGSREFESLWHLGCRRIRGRTCGLDSTRKIQPMAILAANRGQEQERDGGHSDEDQQDAKARNQRQCLAISWLVSSNVGSEKAGMDW